MFAMHIKHTSGNPSAFYFHQEITAVGISGSGFLASFAFVVTSSQP